VVCLGRRDEVVGTDFGVLHRVRPLVRLERLRAARLRQHQLVWRAWRLRRAVERIVLARPGTRLIHSIGSYGYVGRAARAALRRRGVETVALASVYDTLVREGRAKLRGARDLGARLAFAAELHWNRLVVGRLERWGLAGSRLVLVNYESVRRLLAEELGIVDRVRRIPYSSEAAFLDGRRPAALPTPAAAVSLDGPPLLVAVCRQDPRKGLDVLLHALARLRADGVPFRASLVGGGQLVAAHRRLAARLGLADRVTVEGFVPDPFAYLGRATVFVHPALEEGSGSVALLEALQAGLPVVASAVDGIPEDVEAERSALLVPPGDPAALASALARVLADAALRARLGRAARATFEARFSADGFAAALGGVYRELAEGP
jgi:glycosyltransferase involved in cell wall biosynthesis